MEPAVACGPRKVPADASIMVLYSSLWQFAAGTDHFDSRPIDRHGNAGFAREVGRLSPAIDGDG